MHNYSLFILHSMSIFDFLLSPAKKKGKSHLKNLMIMAMADNILDDKEYEFLKNIASKYDISQNEVDKLKILIEKKNNFDVDANIHRFDQIFDLVRMMMADNHIDKRELQMCKKFAIKIGFSPNITDELVDTIIQNITIGNSLQETKTRLSFLIK